MSSAQHAVVVATGGLSIPKIGASDWGYALARRFGHRIVETRPALVPFVCTGADWQRFAALAGVALPARCAAGSDAARAEFVDDLLFTHRGLSGPAALQISTYWRPGKAIVVDLAPETPLGPTLLAAKRGRRSVATVLGDVLPRRLAEAWLAGNAAGERSVADLRDRDLAALAEGIHAWRVTPATTEGYRKAEVTAGGVDTRDLDSRSLRKPADPGAALHRRGGRRHRLARRLQLPVGLGQRAPPAPGHWGCVAGPGVAGYNRCPLQFFQLR